MRTDPGGHAHTNTPTLRRRARSAGPPALVVIGAALAVAFEGPRWLTTVLSAVAFVLIAERLVRRRQLGWADAVATSAAGLIVVLMLLGFLLDILPGGLGRVSWAIGAGVLALLALAWGERGVQPEAMIADVQPGTLLRLAPAYAFAVVLAAVALVVSVHATHLATRAPVAMSIVGSGAHGRVTVQVSGGRTSGRYVLLVRDGSRAPRVYGPFTVAAGGRAQRTVRVPTTRRSVVSLRTAADRTKVRSLIVAGTTIGKDGP